MPKIVDHEERRRELLAAVWRVVQSEGIERTTTRAIAREAGWSVGALSHYFKDREDVLTSALRMSHRRIKDRWTVLLEGLAGITALRELVLDNLPLDEGRALETRLEVAFWARALTRDAVLVVQQAEAAALHRRVLDLVQEAKECGEIRDKGSTEQITERLLALIDGLSLHAVLYPERLALLREVVDGEFARLVDKPRRAP